MNKPRRRKGEGTVVQIGSGHYARKRIGGTTVYGPRRPSEARAERDLKNLGPSYTAGKVPDLREWAFDCMSGSYGKSLAVNTFDMLETIRGARLNAHPIGKMRLDMIARRHCQDFMDDQALFSLRWDPKEKKTVRTDAPPSAAYLRRVAGFLGRLFTLAIEDGHGWIEGNPAQRLRLPTLYERENRILTQGEWIRLDNPCTTFEQILKVYAYTGLRRAELVRLKWEHLGISKLGLLSVPGTKTAHSRTQIEIPESIVEILKAQPERSDYIFTTAKGEPYRPIAITRAFARWRHKHGFPPEMRLQDLRGSFAVQLVRQGEPIRVVLDMLRKRDAKDLINSYLRSSREDRRSAVDRLEQNLKQAAKGKAIERLASAIDSPRVDDMSLLEALTTLRNMGAQVELKENGYHATLQLGSEPLVLTPQELVDRFGPRDAEIIKLPGVG